MGDLLNDDVVVVEKRTRCWSSNKNSQTVVTIPIKNYTSHSSTCLIQLQRHLSSLLEKSRMQASQYVRR